jgi:AcrR family transcriptional regulator
MSKSLTAPRSRVSAGAVRSTEAHEAILAAGREVLRERGYGGFTIEAVARAAKASKPTIYRWWPNKAALIHELYVREAAEELSVPDLGSAEAELVELTRRTWAMWRKPGNGCAVKGLIAEAQTNGEALRQLRDEFLPTQRQRTEAILSRAEARGEIARGADANAVFGIYKGFTWYCLLTGGISEADEPSIAPVMRLIVKGLQGTGALPAAASPPARPSSSHARSGPGRP